MSPGCYDRLPLRCRRYERQNAHAHHQRAELCISAPPQAFAFVDTRRLSGRHLHRQGRECASCSTTGNLGCLALPHFAAQCPASLQAHICVGNPPTNRFGQSDSLPGWRLLVRRASARIHAVHTVMAKSLEDTRETTSRNTRLELWKEIAVSAARRDDGTTLGEARASARAAASPRQARLRLRVHGRDRCVA